MQDTEPDETLEPLLALGLLQPRFSYEQALAALNDVGGERAAAFLHGHKVTGFARDACRLARTAPPTTAKLLHFDEGVAVQGADDLFLPTVDYVLSERLVRAAAAR